MDLTTYAGLQSAIADFLNRSDLTAQIPGFIALAEAEIKRVTRLTTQFTSFEFLSNSTTTNEVLAQAPDIYLYGSLLQAAPFLEHDTRVQTWQALFDRAVQEFNDRRDRTGLTGAPDLTNYDGLQTAIARTLNRTDVSYLLPQFITLAEAEIRRQVQITPAPTSLSEAAPSNMILADAPDIYYFGSLVQAAPFLGNDDRIDVWRTMFDRAVAQYNARRDRTGFASTPDLTTYAGLQAVVGQMLNRSDLTAQVPGFIAIAEARIKREARLRRAQTAVTLTNAAMDIPTLIGGPVQEIESIKLASSMPSADAPLEICTITEARDHATYWTSPGRPRYAAIVGQTLNVVPAPDQDYTLDIVYTPALLPLSATNVSNEILAYAPDAYLYGALAAAAPFLDNDPRADGWEAAYQKALRSLRIQREREEFSGSPKSIRLPRVF